MGYFGEQVGPAKTPLSTMINDRSIYTYDHITGDHIKLNPDESIDLASSGLIEQVYFDFNYNVSLYLYYIFRSKSFQKKKKLSYGSYKEITHCTEVLLSCIESTITILNQSQVSAESSTKTQEI